METWRITAKTEILSKSISCKFNGNFGLWCPGSDFVPHGETVNTQYYAAYLQNHLCCAVGITEHNCKLWWFCLIVLLHIRWFVPGICYDAGGRKYWSIHHTHRTLHEYRFRTSDDIAIAVWHLIMTNFSHGEVDGIRRLPDRRQCTIGSLGDYFRSLENVNVFGNAFFINGYH